tara:strand:+ start:2508 stop:3401 length:894 start_codon:yes stop_codon:yes gene_type:complete
MKILLFCLIVLILITIILFIIKFFKYNDNELYKSIKNVKYTGDYKIPKIIHQVWLQGYDSLDSNIKNVIKENLKMNLEWNYKFYDYEKIDKFIKEHESQYVYNAFKKINPKYGAVVSDLFRYIIMYHEGGVYMDTKCKTNIPLDDWVHKNKLQFSFFGPTNILLNKYIDYKIFKNTSPREIGQCFLLYPKNHEILRLLINTITKKIYKFNNNNIINFFPNKIKNIYKIFTLTGPWIYTKVLLPYIINNINDCIIYNKNELDGFYNGYILYDGTNGKYHKKEHSKKKHYIHLKEKIIL